MSLTTDLQRIDIRPRRGTGRLPAAKPRDPLPASKASAYPQYEDKPSGGIASPVTENKEPDGGGGYLPSRTYVQDGGGDKIFLLRSTDGLYTFEHKLLQQIDMTDANGSPVSFIYQEVDPDTGAAYPDP